MRSFVIRLFILLGLFFSTFASAATSSLTGLWWNPNESGWGMSLTQQGTTVFVAWYTYDSNGKPVWYVMSSCPVVGDGCTGDIYDVKGGTPLGMPWNGSGIAVTKVGTGTLTFSDYNTGAFNYSVNGVSGTRNIIRQVFATGASQPATDYSALWWNEGESGWGVALTQQYGTIFATLYSYDDSGNPVWYVASNCTLSGNGCSGDLYQVTGGSAPSVAWNGANLAVAQVGSINFAFSDSSTGAMSYTINGVSSSKAVAWQLFGMAAPGTTPAPPSNLSTDPAGVAAALANPDTVNLGIWSLLKELKIGVYELSGDAMMEGEERNADDFWFYDFQIASLEKAALESKMTFSNFHKMLASVYGFSNSAEELLGIYRDTYAANPDSFLARFFASQGLVFTGDPEITGLQGILLIIDGFMPEQTTVRSTANAHALRYGVLARTPSVGKASPLASAQAKFNICMGIDAVEDLAKGKVKGWAVEQIATRVLGKGTVKALTGPFGWAMTAYKTADAMAFSFDFERNIGIYGPRSTHVKTCEYPSPTINIGASIAIRGKNDMQEKVAKCGRMSGIGGLSSDQTSIPSVDVTLRVSGAGMSRTDAQSVTKKTTDSYGKAELFIAPLATNECEGQETSAPVEVTAEFDTGKLIAAMGLDDWENHAAGILTQVLDNSVYQRTPATFTVQYRASKYWVDWYMGENHVWGTICNGLEKPFTLSFDSGGVIVGEFAFIPTNGSGGTVKETGWLASAPVPVDYKGVGTYTVSGTSLSMAISKQIGTMTLPPPVGVQTVELPGLSATFELLATDKCN